MSTNLGHDINKDTSRAFEFASCYWVHIFYNQLYLKAMDTHERTGKKSLTETYIDMVNYFANQVKTNPESYKQVMTGIYRHFMDQHHVQALGQTYSRFYDYYLSLFLPADVIPKMTSSDKSQLYTVIMSHLLDRIRVCFTRSDALHLLIDDHMNANNTRFFVEEVYTMYVTERDCMYDNFVESTVKDSEWVETISQLRHTIGKYHKKNRTLAQENAQLVERLAHVQEEYDRVIESYGELYRKCRSVLKHDPEMPMPGPLSAHKQRAIMLPDSSEEEDSDAETADSESQGSADSGRKSRHSSRTKATSRSSRSTRSHRSNAPGLLNLESMVNQDIQRLANMAAQ